MSILTVEKLSHSFGGRIVLEDVSFRLLKGEHVGLVGPNGEGKSTFMKIITNQLIPEEGKVVWANKVQVGYLDQHAELKDGDTIREVLRSAYQHFFDMEKEMLAHYERMSTLSEQEMTELLEEIGDIQTTLDIHDFYSLDSKIEEVVTALGIADYGLDKNVAELSGGQRSKVLLAKLLLEKPDILLLDEPTNYLDEEHIVWLKNYLLNYENAFVLISHDIPFLNEVVNLIYHIENATLTRYVGNYDEFERLHQQNRIQLEKAYEKQQAEIARLEDFVARNKARVATRGMAQSRVKKLEKMDRITLNKEKEKPIFDFMYGNTPSKVIFHAKELVIGYDKALSKPMDLELERGNKVALIGANGLGKSTLLKSLQSLIPAISGTVEQGEHLQIAYYKQEEVDSDKTCLQDFWDEYPAYTQYEARSALAKCGLTTNQIESKVVVLSGGEKAKLRICKLMNRPSNVLILDEPTNHLDPLAKEALMEALQKYKGTILLVSHEPEFYQSIVEAVWDMGVFSISK